MRNRSVPVVKIIGAVIAIAGILGLCACSLGQSSSAPLPSAVAVHPQAPCTGYKTWGIPNVAPLDTGKTYTAVVTTNKGVITIKLRPQVAPIAVQSFIFLAQHHYFDGVRFHRVVPGFVIQGGDPRGNGQGGPGYSVVEAPPSGLKYTRGVVAMAKTEIQDPGTSGSQFFVVTGPDAQLPADYALVGKVSAGLNVVDRIATAPTDQSNPDPARREQPRRPVVIRRITIRESR
jgi:peptidyl-prolyl cis-trans isomerase B (cyclophilin B)